MTEEKKLTWMQLMWRNFFVQLFILAAVFLGIEIAFYDEFYSVSALYIGISIPIGIMVLIICNGFIKFWNSYKKSIK